MIVFVQIGNSDDKLTQREWSQFIEEVRELILLDSTVIGEWFSAPDQPWQNVCWMYEIAERNRGADMSHLRRLCAKYRQDSIAWTEAPRTLFLSPSTQEEEAE